MDDNEENIGAFITKTERISEEEKVEKKAEEIAKKLTGTGLEVEDLTSYESVKGALKGVVVGKVIYCVDHPNSDHLHITKVDVGAEEPLNIVCGAPNVAEGQKVLEYLLKDEIKSGKVQFKVIDGLTI